MPHGSAHAAGFGGSVSPVAPSIRISPPREKMPPVIPVPAVRDTDQGVAFQTQALLEPANQATLSARMASQILSVTVDEGDVFKKGQTLVAFDCDLPKARLRKAQADRQAARKRLAVIKRMEALDGVSELEMATARTTLARENAEVDLIQAQVRFCAVKAPFAGRVVKRLVHPHDSVSKEEDLLKIVDHKQLNVRLYIPAAWLRWVKTGHRFAVEIPSLERVVSAQVTSLGARVDAGSQTLTIRGAITETQPDLLPGLDGVARFEPPDAGSGSTP
ncbi:MAG: efflux RND transporter periplasmic adaptor subunit [Magnetococcales bacterium]|nr:efflux RND transporter periplasmic adaptor subunit [Magnetococcales bacterium]